MYPTLFISHGAPNIILGDSKSKKSIERLGAELPIPKYIIIVSAHYVTRSLKVINPTANKIMYDFYGFEDELYKVQYEIKSEEFATFDLIDKLKEQSTSIEIFESYGFDMEADNLEKIYDSLLEIIESNLGNFYVFARKKGLNWTNETDILKTNNKFAKEIEKYGLNRKLERPARKKNIILEELSKKK